MGDALISFAVLDSAAATTDSTVETTTTETPTTETTTVENPTTEVETPVEDSTTGKETELTNSDGTDKTPEEQEAFKTAAAAKQHQTKHSRSYSC